MKRRALQVIVLLMLGAIVNVAGAWASLVMLTNSADDWIAAGGYTSTLNSTEEQNWRVLVFSRPAVAIVWWEQEVGAVPQDSPLVSRPRWSRKPAVKHSDGDRFILWHFVEVAAGWPLSAHYCTASIDRNRNVASSSGAIDSPFEMKEFPLAGITSRPRLLPIQPLWPGFAINTIFYAAVLWMMFVMPFALRRRLRIRRGLCPACAYPIGSSPVCTECGNRIKRSEVSGQKSENVQA